MRTARTYQCVPTPSGAAVGAALRTWREHRRYSQLDLAHNVGVSARHLSFVENGRSQPSREMLLRLFESLEVPHRECNTMMLTAGYAPAFSARPLEDPGLANVRQAMTLVLRGLEPCPALAVDRYWNMIDANRPARLLSSGIAAELMTPPVNVLRMSLHPGGMSKNIVNLKGWRAIVLRRLGREIETTNDPVLVDLHRELSSYNAHLKPDGEPGSPDLETDSWPILVPMRLRTALGEMSFWSTTTVFGTAVDASVSEVAIEAFLPANDETRQALQVLAEGLTGPR